MAQTAGRTMDVNIVAEDRPLWSGQATSVVVPALGGYMGILPDHEPVLAIVGAGTISVTCVDEEKSFPVEGGFISFEENTLTIGVDKAFC
ncbi:F0F1 ATP synthase subunit epsilon [Alloscardovia macacae]|uniref:ATP synthase F0F1 subunit epsilon n=1 Tax=Alloscardovia macacae TaxID=1160091 RepID=A0A1Y2STX5_9BIFI|nr:F0F1 ATP synthase subunit epsilon [Alloscardovia macacae]OTA26481.1 hypothetical protein B9G54_04640 [Alloscardovia macacae]OTA29841.1 hypothetical protein B9T39_01810 [Alloscardovia macacae]OZG53843.1 ATP synthase F0F1 subunit epsilon [Alloscardovia macacae]